MISIFLMSIKGALFLNCAVCGWLLFPLKSQRRKKTTSTADGAEQSFPYHIPVPPAFNRGKKKVKQNKNKISRIILYILNVLIEYR